METIKITGQVFKVCNTIKKTDSFKMRELWLTYGDKYPQTIAIQFNNAKTDLLNNITPGETVTVSLNINGRIFNGQDGQKVYNTITGWDLQYSSVAKPKEIQSTSEKMRQAPLEINDDLPF